MQEPFLPVNENIHVFSRKDHMCCSYQQWDSGCPQREPRCLLDKSHNFPDLLWAWPPQRKCRQALGNRTLPDSRAQGCVSVGSGGRFASSRSHELSHQPLWSSQGLDGAKIITPRSCCFRELPEKTLRSVMTKVGKYCSLHGTPFIYCVLRKAPEWRHCLFLLSRSHERERREWTETDTSGTRARHDLLTFLPDLKLLT